MAQELLIKKDQVEALTSNTAVLTCLANDIGYDKIFSEQIKVKVEKMTFC